MKTIVKIEFHKPTKLWFALTACTDKQGNKIQKFGNDLNIYAATKEECKNKAACYMITGLIENGFFI